MKTVKNRRVGKPGRRIRRRGTLYVAVMGVTVIVSMLALSAMHVARLHLKSTLSDGNRHQARLLAASAIEHAIAEFNTNSNWQTDYTLNTEYPTTPVAVGGGTFTWKLVDAGGTKRRLDGIGRVADAQCILSVDLKLPQGLDLDCAILSEGNLTMSNRTVTVTGGPIATNGTLTNQYDIYADVEAATIDNYWDIYGTQTAPVPPRVLPDENTVFDYYLARGTLIDPTGTIANVVLSPNSNPYGTPNADGIYIVDAAGGGLTIRDCRIVGTLVVQNVGSDVTVEGTVNWEPAYLNFPAIMVAGDLRLRIVAGSVDETLAAVPNLNPVGTPFGGETDAVEDDQYISSIAGIIYCSGDLKLDGNGGPGDEQDYQGLLIAGGTADLVGNVDATIDYDSTFANQPPPGFGSAAPPSAEQQWLDQNSSNSGSGSNYTLATNIGIGTYFAPPALPAEATSWAVTRIQLYCNDGGSTGTFDAQVTKADGLLKPAQIVESVTVQETSLPGTFNWYEITFANASGLSPSEGACLVCMDNTNSGARLKCGVNSLGSPETHRLTSVDGGGNWAVEADNDMWIKIWGTYTIGGNEVAIVPGSWRQTPGP